MQGVGLDLSPANGSVRVKGGANTLSINGLATITGATQGSLALTSSAGNTTTIGPR